MATIVAAQTGVWSATATWAGGVLPGAGDVAQTSTFTVTIDQAITVTTLEPTSSGRFECGASRTINANLVMSSTSAFGGLRFTHTSGTSTLNGNVTGASTGVPAIVVVSGGTITINGNVTAGSAANAYGINNAGAGTVTVNGTVTGGSAAAAYGLFNNSTGTATVTTATGGSAVSAQGLFGNNAGGTTKARAFVSGSTGCSPIGGFVLIDEDAANNTFTMRKTSGGATVVMAVVDYPAVGDVQSGVVYGNSAYTGTFAVPAAADVESGVGYGAGGTEFTGTMTLPAEADVRDGTDYGAGGTEFEGTLHVPTGIVEQVITADVEDGVEEFIRDFFPGTTKAFTVVIKVGGVAQNITADTVTFRMKAHPDDTDAQAAITEVADVVTSGATGGAIFELHPADTDITAKQYWYDVVWETGTDVYVILSGRVRVRNRVSDL